MFFPLKAVVVEFSCKILKNRASCWKLLSGRWQRAIWMQHLKSPSLLTSGERFFWISRLPRGWGHEPRQICIIRPVLVYPVICHSKMLSSICYLCIIWTREGGKAADSTSVSGGEGNQPSCSLIFPTEINNFSTSLPFLLLQRVPGSVL